MTKVVVDDINLKNTANAIREKTGNEALIKPPEFAKEIPKVYDAGKDDLRLDIEQSNAKLEDIIYGTSSGGKSWYDEFWDEFQENGNRTDYEYGFGGKGWTANNFKPKYDIKLKDGSLEFMFANSLNGVSLANALKENGVKLDFSGVTNVTDLFSWCTTNHLPEIGANTVTNATKFLYVAWRVTTIDKFTVAPDCIMTNAFFRCDVLKNIAITNEIAGNGWNFQWSPKLSHDSIVNIINKLSSNTSNLTITFSKQAVSTAFETAENLADGTSSTEWKALIATKSNWTISLV